MLKDPIFGLPMTPVPNEHIKLTGPEASAQRNQMQEHREFKCARCVGRFDFDSGTYVCMKSMNAEWVMKNDKTCKKFTLNENQADWQSDI